MTDDRKLWRFPDTEVTVRWRPRDRTFAIRWETEDGRYVQSVRVEDADLEQELRSRMDDGTCPIGDDQWPVDVCIDNAVPADERWHPFNYTIIASGFPDVDTPTDVEYFQNPDEAVGFAMDAWASLTYAQRTSMRVMVCEVDDDHPVSGGCGECLWVSEMDPSADEGVWMGVVPVVRSGNSLIVRLTDVCAKLGVRPNEEVEITIRKRRSK